MTKLKLKLLWSLINNVSSASTILTVIYSCLHPSDKYITVWWVYLFSGFFSATDSLLFWGTVYISFEEYFPKYHKIIPSLGILAVFMSSHILDAFIELLCSSSKDFKLTYHMHQTWLNKCMMSGKQSDENFWCRDNCKEEKKVRNWTYINQAFFFCSTAAWNGVNFLPCFGRLPAPHAVCRRARASSRILLWLP